jgi:hypothetical protein
MAPLHLVALAGLPPRSDAALPQAEALSDFPCQFGMLSAIVHAGRTQAVCTSRRGSACCTTLQEHRSRGCRAPRSFCRCAWLPSWRPALASRKKSSTWKNRLSRSNRPTPASTSKTIGRASWVVAARPALFLSAAWAKTAAAASGRFEQSSGTRYAGAVETHFQRRFSCGQLPSLPFLPSLPSRHAPARPPSPSRCPSRLSPHRPANTAPDIPERARRGDRPAPVPTPRAPAKEVRPC